MQWRNSGFITPKPSFESNPATNKINNLENLALLNLGAQALWPAHSEISLSTDRTCRAWTIRCGRLLVTDSCRRAVEFGDVDSKRLIVRFGPVLQDAKCNLLAQENRPISRAAEVYARMNPMTKRDVVR